MNTQPDKLKNRTGSLLLMLALMAFTFVFVLKDSSASSLLSAFRLANPVLIAGALGLMALFMLLEGFKIQTGLQAVEQKVSFWRCLSFAFVGFYFNAVTPSSSGGQPAQVWFMKRSGIHVSHSTLSLLLLALAHQVVTLSLGGVLFFTQYEFLAPIAGKLRYLFIFGITFNLLLLLAILFVIFSPTAAKSIVLPVIRFLGKIKLVRDTQKAEETALVQIEEYVQGAKCLKSHPLAFFKLFGTTLVQTVIMYLIPFCIYKAFFLQGYTMLQVIAAQSFLTLSVSSLPLPGSVGVSENGFLSLFRLIFGANLVLPAMLLTRGINFYLFFLISGAVSLLAYLASAKRGRAVSSLLTAARKKKARSRV